MNKESKNKINLRFVIFSGIFIAGVIALCVWGCISTYKAARVVCIQCFEEPIRDYTILGFNEKVSRPTRSTYDSGSEEERTTYMTVQYKQNIYNVRVQSLGSMSKNPQNYKLYYDEKNDEIFMSGSGIMRLAFSIIIISIIVFLTWKIRSNIKKSKAQHSQQNIS